MCVWIGNCWISSAFYKALEIYNLHIKTKRCMPTVDMLVWFMAHVISIMWYVVDQLGKERDSMVYFWCNNFSTVQYLMLCSCSVKWFIKCEAWLCCMSWNVDESLIVFCTWITCIAFWRDWLPLSRLQILPLTLAWQRGICAI